MKIGMYSVLAFSASLMASESAFFADEVKKGAVIVSMDGNKINAQTREGPISVSTTPDTKIFRE